MSTLADIIAWAPILAVLLALALLVTERVAASKGEDYELEPRAPEKPRPCALSDPTPEGSALRPPTPGEKGEPMKGRPIRRSLVADHDDVAPPRYSGGQRRVYWEASVNRWVELWPAHAPQRSSLLPEGVELDAPKDGKEHLIGGSS